MKSIIIRKNFFFLLLGILLITMGCGKKDVDIQSDAVINKDTVPKEIVEISGIMPEFSIEELIERSSLIVYGEVSGKSEAFTIESVDGEESNFTDYYVTPIKILRGDLVDTENKIAVRIQGGFAGDTLVIDEQAPVLESNHRYLLFLRKSSMGGGYNTVGDYYYINGGTQGVYVEDVSDSIVKKSSEEISLISEAQENSENNMSSEDNINLKDFSFELNNYNENNPVDEKYFEKEYKENLKRNLDNHLITQEDYDMYLEAMNQYAVIK